MTISSDYSKKLFNKIRKKKSLCVLVDVDITIPVNKTLHTFRRLTHFYVNGIPSGVHRHPTLELFNRIAHLAANTINWPNVTLKKKRNTSLPLP